MELEVNLERTANPPPSHQSQEQEGRITCLFAEKRSRSQLTAHQPFQQLLSLAEKIKIKRRQIQETLKDGDQQGVMREMKLLLVWWRFFIPPLFSGCFQSPDRVPEVGTSDEQNIHQSLGSHEANFLWRRWIYSHTHTCEHPQNKNFQEVSAKKCSYVEKCREYYSDGDDDNDRLTMSRNPMGSHHSAWCLLLAAVAPPLRVPSWPLSGMGPGRGQESHMQRLFSWFLLMLLRPQRPLGVEQLHDAE